MSELHPFLSGAAVMGFIVAALFFLRFWRGTRDRLFLLFAIAFGIEAVTRGVFALVARPTEGRPIFYLGRLLAYMLILLAILGKNLPPGRTDDGR